MATDPRNVISQLGIGARLETYKHDGTIVYDATLAGGAAQVGRAVKIVAADQVGLTTAGSHVEGKLIKVEAGGYCLVQTKGVTTLPSGTGATATVGRRIMGALLAAAEGYVDSVNPATAAEVAVGGGRLRNGATSTAWVVDLG